MRPYTFKITAQYSPLQLDRMDKRQRLRYSEKSIAHQLNVEPNTREPGGKVRQKRTANTADLLDVEHAAAQ